jgi:hypothetical protein
LTLRRLSIKLAGGFQIIKPIGDRYQFHAKISEKTAIFLRQDNGAAVFILKLF